MMTSTLALALAVGIQHGEELEVRFTGSYSIDPVLGRMNLPSSYPVVPGSQIYNMYAFGKDSVSKLCGGIMNTCGTVLAGKVLVIAQFQSQINIDPASIRGLQDSMYSLIDQQGKLKGLIERPQLDTFLRQRRLEMSDLFDAATVKQLGTLAGSDYLLVGTFVLGGRKETFELNWRLLDCSTGSRTKSDVATFRVVK